MSELMRYLSLAGLLALGSALAAAACNHSAPPPMVPDAPEPIVQEEDGGPVAAPTEAVPQPLPGKQ
jgi:hypothetical protein